MKRIIIVLIILVLLPLGLKLRGQDFGAGQSLYLAGTVGEFIQLHSLPDERQLLASAVRMLSASKAATTRPLPSATSPVAGGSGVGMIQANSPPSPVYPVRRRAGRHRL